MFGWIVFCSAIFGYIYVYKHMFVRGIKVIWIFGELVGTNLLSLSVPHLRISLHIFRNSRPQVKKWLDFVRWILSNLGYSSSHFPEIIWTFSEMKYTIVAIAHWRFCVFLTQLFLGKLGYNTKLSHIRLIMNDFWWFIICKRNTNLMTSNLTSTF